jgi:hypothetical protein
MKTYTFHVSLPGQGRVWRKVEVAADQTLEELHVAIQDAYQFDDDHLYSFFMSGKAWDRSTEYCLPEDADPFDFLFEDDDDGDEVDSEGDLSDEELLAGFGEESAEQLRAALDDQPPPQSFEEMLSLIESTPELRAQVKKIMSEQLGIPGFMADMMVSNLGSLMNMLPQGVFGNVEDHELEEESEPGDVRFTTLDTLDLKVGKKFLYLFDYGDEWRFNVRVHAVNADADPDAEYPRIVESVGQAPQQYPQWEDEEDWEDEDESDEESE